jgi:hypothetical protein
VTDHLEARYGELADPFIVLDDKDDSAQSGLRRAHALARTPLDRRGAPPAAGIG